MNITDPPDMGSREAILSETERNVSVQASAGTGKTTLMVERVIRLVQRGVRLDRLAVVTFTDAAASELRLRIRTRLGQEASRGDSRCHEALAGVASSWISTIHGFASRVLKEFFNLTGVDPAFSVTETHFQPVEIKREWNAWLLNRDPTQAEKRLLKATGTEIQRNIALGIEARRWLDSPEGVGNAATVKGILEEYMDVHGENVRRVLKECSDPDDGLYGPGREFLLGLERMMDRMPDLEPGTAVELAGMIKLNRGRKGSWQDKDRAKEVLGLARDRFREIAPVMESGELTEISWGFAGDFAEELRRKWDGDRSRLSYGDLLYSTRTSIAKSQRLAAILREKFDHILIDEFQDTSREQALLFRAFLLQGGSIPPGRITIVADDKQSIYGWRNADIETYNEFRHNLESGGALTETISTNFRSSASIVDFINTFGPALFQAGSGDEEKFSCGYSPILPAPDAPRGDRVDVLQVPSMPEEYGSRVSGSSWSARVQARWFADYVEKGMEKGDLPEDYALLFRSGTHIHHFVDSLEEKGIPYRLGSSKDFLSRQEIVDLREMIRCLSFPGDRLAWVHTLRSLFLGVTDDDVSIAIWKGRKGYLKDDVTGVVTVDSANGMLRELRRLMVSMPFAHFFHELVLRGEMVGVICAGGYQVTRRLNGLQRLLEEVATGNIGTPLELLRVLNERFTPKRPEEPSSVPIEGGAVTLSTIHSAKGLSWKRVVLAAMSTREQGQRDGFISYEHAGKAAFSLGLYLDDSGRTVMRSPYWPEIAAIEKARGRAETRRLIYVAVTRARENLTLLANPCESGSSDAAILWQGLQEAMEEDPRCCILSEIEPLMESLFPARAGHGGGMSIGEPQVPIGGDFFPVDPVPVDFQSPGAVLGEHVHQVMEKIDMTDPSGWLNANGKNLSAVYGRELDRIRELCLNFFEMQLPFELEECTVIGREYPYIVHTPPGVKKRYIDLVLVEPNGSIIEVDYKTDDLDRPDAQRVVDSYMETQRHYMEDLSAIFGRKVRGYLVFLRHRKVVEVK